MPATVTDIQVLDLKVDRLEYEMAELKIAFQLASKAVKRVMANEILQKSLNEDLIIMDKRKKACSGQSKRTGGKGQVMT
jgi:hypothetical protein